MFGEKVHDGGRPFQILNGRSPPGSGALPGLNAVLNVNSRLIFPLRYQGRPEGLGLRR